MKAGNPTLWDVIDTVTPYDNNLLHNSKMDIWQRTTNLTLATNSIGYAADRWRCYNGSMTYTASVARVDLYTVASSLAPGDLRWAARLTSGGAGQTINGSYQFNFSQRIEDVTTYNGRTVTVSFYARSINNSAQFLVVLYQNFGTGGSTQTATASSTITLPAVSTSQAFTRYEVQLTLPSTLGKTIASDGSDNLQLAFQFLPSTAQINVDMTQIKLEPGNFATPYVPRPFQEEMRMCQRYYQKSFAYTDAPASGNAVGRNMTAAAIAGTSYYWTINLPVAMRAVPSVTFYNPSSTGGANLAINYQRSTAAASTTLTGQTTAKMIEIAMGAGTSWAAGDLLGIQWTADADSNW